MCQGSAQAASREPCWLPSLACKGRGQGRSKMSCSSLPQAWPRLALTGGFCGRDW